jgi:hypothetical protein
VSRGQRNDSPTIIITRLNGPRSRPTTSQKKFGSAEKLTLTSGSVARNSDRQTIEAVGEEWYLLIFNAM